jgi:hypothetical protein
MKLVYTYTIDENTFSFYVQLGTKFHNVKVIHFTTFAGTELEKDFPNGSTGTITGTAPLFCKTEKDCVNFVAPKFLKNWKPI